jgi:hypothetical protein
MNNLNGRIPMLGQQQMTREQAKLQLAQLMDSLSLSIYSSMAKEYLAHIEHVDIEKLKSMARNSRVAAEAYFEALIQSQA